MNLGLDRDGSGMTALITGSKKHFQCFAGTIPLPPKPAKNSWTNGNSDSRNELYKTLGGTMSRQLNYCYPFYWKCMEPSPSIVLLIKKTRRAKAKANFNHCYYQESCSIQYHKQTHISSTPGHKTALDYAIERECHKTRKLLESMGAMTFADQLII